MEGLPWWRPFYYKPEIPGTATTNSVLIYIKISLQRVAFQLQLNYWIGELFGK